MKKSKTLYQRILKPIVDFWMALVIMPFLIALVLVLALPQLVLYKRIFFLQSRPGLNEVPFLLIKFQTMQEGDLADDERVTKLGLFLRKTSLDEVPQVINILRGQMSFVGPRPLLLEYLDRYSEKHRQRHLVKPGLTGWAQIHGRNNVDWSTRLDLDTLYVQEISLRKDLLIIFRTFCHLFIRTNNSHTVSKFRGYEGES